MKEDIYFESGSLKLVGTLYKAPKEKASALLIAGGGNTHRHKGYYPPWQNFLLENGVTTFNFDFRGVGDAEGNLNESNLNTRAEDAKAALEILKQHSDTENIFVVGVSMGGPVAIRIVDHSIKGMLLVVAAAYSMEARDKNFGPEFSEAIRKPDSWKDSPDFKDLERYMGDTFLLYTDSDEVVPQGISLNYEEIIKAKGGQVLALKDANHRTWKEGQQEYALREMSNFILEKSLSKVYS
ncbi:MAG: hypothetical protein JWN89_637 [Parcubacteria group bacterium]|nr:hypothetical protein [Parcubacteria group bacterium]